MTPEDVSILGRLYWVAPLYRPIERWHRMLEAQECRERVGIGVGLYDDYGPAQRPYVRMGYVPDERGATSGGLPVVGGQRLRCDDEVLIWLITTLR